MPTITGADAPTLSAQSKQGLWQDRWNILLLILLYGVQGVPLGLSSGAMYGPAACQDQLHFGFWRIGMAAGSTQLALHAACSIRLLLDADCWHSLSRSLSACTLTTLTGRQARR